MQQLILLKGAYLDNMQITFLKDNLTHKFIIFMNGPCKKKKKKSLWSPLIAVNTEKDHTIISFWTVYFWVKKETVWKLTVQNTRLYLEQYKYKSKAGISLTGRLLGGILSF